MSAQKNKKSKLAKLNKKQDELRQKLKEHFSLPVSKRNYKRFEAVVDELENLRQRIYKLRTKKTAMDYRSCIKLLMVSVLFLSFSSILYAEYNYTRQDKSGLEGKEFVSVALHPANEDVIFVGTDKGLYKKNIASDDSWKAVGGLPPGQCQVNQILFTPAEGCGYIATDKGIYKLQLDPLVCENIFSRSNELERDCLSVCMLVNKTIFAGTRTGLFVKKAGKEWSKVGSLLSNEEIVSLYCQGSIVYAASKTGVFKSGDEGQGWEKIFNVYGYEEVSEEGADSDSDELEVEASSVRYLIGSRGNADLYVVTTSAIFVSENLGKEWKRLSSSGLGLANLRFFAKDIFSKRIFAVAKIGVYELKGDSWERLISLYDCRRIALTKTGFILITYKDIFKYLFSNEKGLEDIASMSSNEVLGLFEGEPSVIEVQRMAIAFAEVSNEKIRDWRRRAKIKAALPKLSFGYNNNVYGSSSGTFAVGPNDWDVAATWELGELIYNGDQTTIDVRSKLMVQLRNDILSEATSLYFERRRLQIELLSNKEIPRKEELDKKLRLKELTAMLDRLTGGQFSKEMQRIR